MGDPSQPMASTQLLYKTNEYNLSSIPTNIENVTWDTDFTKLYLNKLRIQLSSAQSEALYNLGYRKVRLLYIPPNKSQRKYPAQGFLTNTIFSPKFRATNAPWAATDYRARPKEVYRMYNENTEAFKYWSNNSITVEALDDSGSTISTQRYHRSPYFVPFVNKYFYKDGDSISILRHNYGHLMPINKEFAAPSIKEQTIVPFLETPGADDNIDYNAKNHSYQPALVDLSDQHFYMDENIVDFWSPDIEFQEAEQQFYENATARIKIRGTSHVVSTTTSSTITKQTNDSYSITGYSRGANYNPYSGLSKNHLQDNEYLKPLSKEFPFIPDYQYIQGEAGISRYLLFRTVDSDIGSAEGISSYI